MDNSYQKERVKLTVLYFGIILFIVVIFSSLVLHSQNEQFKRFDKFNESVRRAPPPLQSDPLDRLARENIERVETIVKAIKRENLKSILILDIPLLAFASMLSYYLSGRTLEPILYTLEKQKRFVSDASHELKTPLTSIKTEAEVLNRSQKSTLEEYKEFTTNVIEDVNRLDDLVKMLLDIDRTGHRALKIEKTRVDLVKVVNESITEFKSIADKRNISLSLNSEKSKLLFNTDKKILQRLISIFIDNAIKYNKDEGSVEITILGSKKESPVIQIKDTGIGISKKDLPRIFDRFYRASEDRNEKGFGLGLSIAEQLAKELGIEIDVKSKVGEGTVFVLGFN
jgi:signal transduction histidine kinase